MFRCDIMNKENETIINIDASVSECQILDTVRDNYKIFANKYNRNIVYLPMFFNPKLSRCWITNLNGNKEPKRMYHIFKYAKKQKGNKKTNINATLYTYSNNKKQLTILYRHFKNYWNVIKYIVFVYQKEITTFDIKIKILKKYIDDLQYYHYKESEINKQINRVNLQDELLKEVDNIIETNTVNIVFDTKKEVL